MLRMHHFSRTERDRFRLRPPPFLQENPRADRPNVPAAPADGGPAGGGSG